MRLFIRGEGWGVPELEDRRVCIEGGCGKDDIPVISLLSVEMGYCRSDNADITVGTCASMPTKTGLLA